MNEKTTPSFSEPLTAVAQGVVDSKFNTAAECVGDVADALAVVVDALESLPVKKLVEIKVDSVADLPTAREILLDPATNRAVPIFHIATENEELFAIRVSDLDDAKASLLVAALESLAAGFEECEEKARLSIGELAGLPSGPAGEISSQEGNRNSPPTPQH